MYEGQEIDEAIAKIENTCFVYDDCIILKRNEKSPGYYDIPLKWCRTNKDVFNWLLHLTRKNWVTVDMIQKFTKIVLRNSLTNQ